jgi:endo-1,4-beta-D-glucanase Y
MPNAQFPETPACGTEALRAPLYRREFLRAALGTAVGATLGTTLWTALGTASVGLLPAMTLIPSIGAASLPTVRRLPAAPGRFTASAADQAEWHAFRDRFIAPEGRVVDTGNGGISHSEGQGYGLLLAEWANDRLAFERLLGWTRANMSRPYDSLHVWCWNPNQTPQVRDLNTATDGELSIAWALLRAADRWGVREWRQRAEAMGRDILAVSARDAGGRLFLAPGAEGFDRRDRIVVNPSYYNFPAIRALASATQDARWAQVESDGLWLLARARFGRYGLPADWVEVLTANAEVQPATGRRLMFSWDALRIPLYLSWAGETTAPALASAVRFWNTGKRGMVPAWIDLRSDTPAPYAGHAGVVAIARLSMAAITGGGEVGEMPMPSDAPDYYSAALAMLARAAWQESRMAPHVAARMEASGTTQPSG